MKPIRIGFVMDTIDLINPKKDTSLAFMLEAQSRGWQLVYITLNNMYIENGRAKGLLRNVEVFSDLQHWYKFTGEETGLLSSLDIILMRKDPPFDIEYIIATYILEKAQSEGTLVVNNPQALRDANEKIFTTMFPHCCPPGLLTRSKSSIKKFLIENKKIVIKPTDKMGGQSVFVIANNDSNTNVIIEEATKLGTKFVFAQAYIPEIENSGDKRILIINGHPIKYGIARIPAGGDHRGNMAAGGQVKGIELTERDKWICKQLAPELKKRGLLFVGIDVIGDYLTEINVTSPTGVREIDTLFKTNVSAIFLNALASLLKSNN